MRNLFAAVILSTVAITAVDPALAANECRGLAEVTKSAAGWKENLKLGGHIHKHIRNQRTETGKTQFADETTLVKAFATWQGIKLDPNKSFKAKTCMVAGGGLDCLPLTTNQDFGVTVGYKCLKLKQNEEKITKQQKELLVKTEGEGDYCAEDKWFKPTHVGFNYAKVNKVWILNTAYPSEDENCH